MTKSKSSVLTEIDELGSVEQHDCGTVTINFMNFSVSMCQYRLRQLSSMLAKAVLIGIKEDLQQPGISSTVVIPLKRDKGLMN